MRLNIGFPVVQTVSCLVYGHVITKFSRMDRFTYVWGYTHMRFACALNDFFKPCQILFVKCGICFAVGLSLDIIDGSKLKIYPLLKVKQYIVKVSGRDILEDYFTGATTSLEIFYHTLRMKTASEKPKETKINVQVVALTDEGYKKSPVKILSKW